MNLHFQPNYLAVSFDQLISNFGANCIIRDRAQLIKDLSEAYPLFSEKNIEKEVDKMLRDVIDQAMIELDFPARDWEEAVRRAGLLLKKGGCVEDQYIESMVRVVKSMGAYIVIGKGIALPHSRSTEGAMKVGISFLRLATPVSFGHPENDPVDLLFGLSSVDNKSHIHALRDLTKVLSDGKRWRLRAASSKEVLALLTSEGRKVEQRKDLKELKRALIKTANKLKDRGLVSGVNRKHLLTGCRRPVFNQPQQTGLRGIDRRESEH